MKRLVPVRPGVSEGPPGIAHYKQLSRCYVYIGIEIVQLGSYQHQTGGGRWSGYPNHRRRGGVANNIVYFTREEFVA